MRFVWGLAAIAVVSAPAAAAVPSTLGEFLAYCSKDAKGCADHLADLDFALLLNAAGKYCGPDELGPAERAKLLDRLSHSQPDKLRGPTDAAVNEALLALYPCKTS